MLDLESVKIIEMLDSIAIGFVIVIALIVVNVGYRKSVKKDVEKTSGHRVNKVYVKQEKKEAEAEENVVVSLRESKITTKSEGDFIEDARFLASKTQRAKKNKAAEKEKGSVKITF